MMPGFAEVTARGPPEGLPPSFAQQRLWFLDPPGPGDPSSNLVLAHRLSGALDELVMRDAFTEVASRHEALRTRVVTTGAGCVAHGLSQSRRLAVWRGPAITL
jgi:hypothetical protein